MHPGQVFAYHSQCEKLRAGKDGNDRGEKRKSRHATFQAITDEDIKENANAKERAAKPNQACELQRRGAKTSHHVERKAY